MEYFCDSRAKLRFDAAKLAKSNLFETERMFCDVYGLEPGQAQTAHVHPSSDKVYFVLQGRGLFQIGAEQKELEEGYVILAPAGLPHAVSNPGPERLALLVFMAPKP